MTPSRNRAVSRRQRRLNQQIKLALKLFALIAIIALIFYLFGMLAGGEWVPGEDVYLRDVYVLVDQTKSMDAAQMKEVKPVIQEQLIDRLGLGDRVFCYRISSNFHEIRDRVFRGEQERSKVPDNLVDAQLEQIPAELRAELIESWELFEAERERWSENLARVEPSDGDYSDYLGTMQNIGRRIKNDTTVASERWLIVAGDLEHDMPNISFEEHAPSKDEKKQFLGVNVYLVFPGGAHNKQRQREIESQWEEYFASRGNKHINIVSFDQFIGDFPTSRVPRPEVLQTTAE